MLGRIADMSPSPLRGRAGIYQAADRTAWIASEGFGISAFDEKEMLFKGPSLVAHLGVGLGCLDLAWSFGITVIGKRE
jgi:hypothetical protein